MGKWLDVNPGDWYYNEVSEASNLLMPNDSTDSFIKGLTYNAFESGAGYLYEEIIATEGQTEFTISSVIDTTKTTLNVYVNGTMVFYKELVGGNKVVLFGGLSAGSLVSFIAPGKPVVDADGRPTTSAAGVYPQVALPLPAGGIYYYNRYKESVVAFGKRLWRVDLTKFNAFRNDIYAIDSGRLFLPYAFNNVTVVVTIAHKTGVVVGARVKAQADSIVYNNRFFPDAKMLKSEYVVLLSRLLEIFYWRFTDTKPARLNDTQFFVCYQGQNVFKSNVLLDDTGVLEVYVGGVLQVINVGFKKMDDYTILLKEPQLKDKRVVIIFKKTGSSRFTDIDSSWCLPYVKELENLKLEYGEKVLPDTTDQFFPDAKVSRAYAAVATNRLRKWCLEHL